METKMKQIKAFCMWYAKNSIKIVSSVNRLQKVTPSHKTLRGLLCNLLNAMMTIAMNRLSGTPVDTSRMWQVDRNVSISIGNGLWAAPRMQLLLVDSRGSMTLHTMTALFSFMSRSSAMNISIELFIIESYYSLRTIRDRLFNFSPTVTGAVGNFHKTEIWERSSNGFWRRKWRGAVAQLKIWRKRINCFHIVWNKFDNRILIRNQTNKNDGHSLFQVDAQRLRKWITQLRNFQEKWSNSLLWSKLSIV